MRRLDENGSEVLDGTPISVPARLKAITQADNLRSMVAGIMSNVAQESGFETFEEANDFDVGDDYDPSSPWELTVDQELEHERLVRGIIESETRSADDANQALQGQSGPSDPAAPAVPTPVPGSGDISGQAST